ncbi:helix-turn-helix domain-containing protein [Bradyrhizobium sp. 183]|uniref:helix-turn-helix domain-containing protein n=1 Tax=unclassified Bradyrhizobium TaxID=2631580 RepID=UPI002000140C|nr:MULTISPECIES: helix-turn-helix domain-containing protein [unclassified Bradyrhizobium]UPJ78589.1 helix-turn-helix domain-containing protein [Bradyrhizobium sp. 184]UPJ86384.1 helix-turn-helix domain-containing protein [Bradyrhizobium sp. 183]
MSNRVLYSLNETADLTGVGLTKLREEIQAKRLIARKLGKRTLITASDLTAWAHSLPQIETRAAA